MLRGLRFLKRAAWFESRSSKPRQGTLGFAAYHRRLGMEPLEDRRLLSVFTVNNLSDGPVAQANDLPGSLRQAIFDSNAAGGANTITFDPTVFAGQSQTINLISGVLEVSDSLTIQGPGANRLTIDATNNAAAGEFVFDSSAINSSISGLTINGGFGPLISDAATGPLSIANCTISDSTSTTGITGNGIDFNAASGGTLTVNGSTLQNNAGNGIYFDGSNGGSLTVSGSTFQNNAGAGIVFNGGSGRSFDSNRRHPGEQHRRWHRFYRGVRRHVRDDEFRFVGK